MAKDISLDLREEAIAAADIESEQQAAENEESSAEHNLESDSHMSGLESAADTRQPSPEVLSQPSGCDEPDSRVRRHNQHNRLANMETRRDNIAGRTRSKARRDPYPVTEHEAGSGSNRTVSPTRAYARGPALADRTNDDVAKKQTVTHSLGGNSTGIDLTTTAIPTAVPVQQQNRHDLEELERALRRIADEEAEESRIYVFVGQGRRGADGLVSRHPRLPRIRSDEIVVECKRRRYRMRTGRYVMEFQVRCRTPVKDRVLAGCYMSRGPGRERSVD